MSHAFQYLHFQDKALTPAGYSIISPISGLIAEIENHSQALYQSGIMGPGACFHVSGHAFHAPFSGVVTQHSPDGNQLLFSAQNGLQLLIKFFGEAHCLHIPENLPKLHVGRKFEQGEFLAYIETRRLERKHIEQQCVISVFNAERFGKVFCGARRFTAGEDSLFIVTPRSKQAQM